MLYHNNHPYYPNRNKGIKLFVVSIIIIVTGIYDSRWRVFSRPRLPVIAWKYILCIIKNKRWNRKCVTNILCIICLYNFALHTTTLAIII